MKQKSLLYIVRALLVAVLCFGSLLLQPAEAADLVIDDSGFTDPTIDHKTIYIWRKGLPEITDESQWSIGWDMLITWNDKYFLRGTKGFISNEQRYVEMKGEEDDDDDYDFKHVGDLDEIECEDKSDAWQIMYRNGFYDYYTYDEDDYDQLYGWDVKGNQLPYPNAYAHGYYHWSISTGMGTNELTAGLPISFSTLQESGITATFSAIADLPVAIRVKGKQDYCYIGFPNPYTSSSSSNYVLLQGRSGLYSWNDKYVASSDEQRTYVRTCLDFVWDCFESGPADRPKLVNRTAAELNSFLWKFEPRDGEYRIYTDSPKFDIEYEHSAVNEDYVYVDFYSANPVDHIALAHEGSNGSFHSIGIIESVGNPFLWNTQGDYSQGTNPYYSDQYSLFDVYWCEPTIMDFLQTDFTVQNGQVSNLDGPIAIANGTTITVQEGGTLTITNWVANNGTIVVENGGTLYIQDDACLNRLADGGHNGGGIKCSGLIIVGRNAKLCGGGVDGIQLYDGSHVVNYGLVTSENFKVTQSYTIENRGENATVFYGSGNGVTGSGMGTWQNAAGKSGYMERGKVEPTCSTNLAPNAIYTY